MKLSVKLNIAFVLLGIALLLLGYWSIGLQRSMSTNFEQFAGRILPSAIEAIKIKSETERVVEYARLYELSHQTEHRWNARSSINTLERSAVIYGVYSQHHLPDSIIIDIQKHIREFNTLASALLLVDPTVEPIRFAEEWEQLRVAQGDIANVLRPLIDKDIVQTKNTQTLLQDKAEVAQNTIIIIIIIGLILLLVAGFTVYWLISRPIQRFTLAAQHISEGDITASIPDDLCKREDEIGVLAKSLQDMVRSLSELVQSRDELNLEINDKIEQEEMQKEQQVALMRSDLSESVRGSQFAMMHILSNRIKTPINGILGFTELLRNDQISPEKHHAYIESIKSSTISLSYLVDNLIELSRIQTNRVSCEYTQCNLLDLGQQLLQQFESERKKRNKKRVHFEFQPDERLKIAVVDRHKIKQVFNNLLDNSLRHTDRGTITFGYTLTETDRIQFFVIDTGYGIDVRERPWIFEYYKIALQSTTHTTNGLGLAIAKGLVEAMNGEIWMETPQGDGTQLFFDVPRIPQNTIEKIDTSQWLQTVDWHEKTIVVVDDEPINLTIIGEILEKTRATVIFAKSAKEVIAKVYEIEKIDVILMDVRMPEVDGYEATRKILAINNKIPIVANTAYAYQHEREDCLKAGCVDYVAKPFTQSELLQTIGRYI